MKRKMTMLNTFKAAIFGEAVTENGTIVSAVKIINDYLVINDECCDLRPIKYRYNPETKELKPSVVENILSAESFMATHYGKRIGERNTMYDFITVDCSGGNDFDTGTKQIKDLLCFSGIHMPLNKLEMVGYLPHDKAEIVEIEGLKYVRYRAALQSASENRQCKLTMTTYPWADFASTISADAKYLHEAVSTAHKSLSRQGLAKTNGHVIDDFKFTFALVPDLETEITFDAQCFNDAENKITAENITTTKTATDGCGFIVSAKARELADKLGLNYVPSAFQIRHGQVKGILLVFDFDKYSNGIIKEDMLITESMYKAHFDTDKAQFLVSNVSKPPRNYAEWNYQMFTTLNSQLTFDDILPYAENIKAHMERALSSPEDALKFLGILSNIASLDSDDGGKDEYDCVDKVSSVIRANPALSLNIRWVKQSIKRKIDLVSKKMLGGKLPMPQSSIAIMGADPISFFNRLRVDEAGNYVFANGELVVPQYKQAKELAAHEFYYGGYEGDLLSFRNPLTHWAQIRKLNCIERKDSAYWYRHLNQVVLFNAHDSTAAGMGGADHDGDMCFLTKLFVDRFRQADYIIYNANDTGTNETKAVLTEELVQRSIRANLQQNMLGVICNINSKCLELMNDDKSLRQFVALAGYMDDKSFGFTDIPQMPYFPKFQNIETARDYLQRLNHELTTLSELEVDRPKTGYVNRFMLNQKEYALPYMPYWFALLKGQLEPFLNRPAEYNGRNNQDEQVRILSKNYNNKTVKSITDTLKSNHKKRTRYVQRTIELMTDGNTIMANIQRYIQENILDMEIDANACFSILESLKAASCLDMEEAERISADVRVVYKGYCRTVAANIKAWKDGAIDEQDFNNALEDIINASDDRLREISSDRAALAFAAYTLSLENGHSSQSFPFLTVLDGMVALLSDVRTVDFYDIKIRHMIPDEATHLIVYSRRFRLPESVCRDKTYFGDVNLPNGSYEIHRDLKGSVSLIVLKPISKNKLNIIPINDRVKFSLKISYKASELLPEHQNGEYVTQLMAHNDISFRETTMNGNTQYCVYADDIWVGSIFDDQTNTWVLKKEISRTLMGKAYSFVGVPRTGAKVDSNSFTTSTGNPRSAQVLTFIKSAATLTAAV